MRSRLGAACAGVHGLPLDAIKQKIRPTGRNNFLPYKSEMTLDHSLLSDSRNFFVWPRVISVHSYYLTSLVTSAFYRLTSASSIQISIPHHISFHYISLSAGSSYMWGFSIDRRRCLGFLFRNTHSLSAVLIICYLLLIFAFSVLYIYSYMLR